MDSVKDAITTVSTWLKTVTEFGITVILALVVIELLFPGFTGIVENIGAIVAQFSSEGLVGLIALLLFLLLFRQQ